LIVAGGGAVADTHVDCPAPVTSSGAVPIDVAALVVGSNVKTSESRKS
jgi:hypothetical protein